MDRNGTADAPLKKHNPEDLAAKVPDAPEGVSSATSSPSAASSSATASPLLWFEALDGDAQLGFAVVPGAFSDADLGAVDAAPRDLGAVFADDRSDNLSFSHNVWRIEVPLRRRARHVYEKALALAEAVDERFWHRLRLARTRYLLYPEIEYIEYDAEAVPPGGEKPSIEPHVDNGSLITMVAMVSDATFEGGVNHFEPGLSADLESDSSMSDSDSNSDAGLEGGVWWEWPPDSDEDLDEAPMSPPMVEEGIAAGRLRRFRGVMHRIESTLEMKPDEDFNVVPCTYEQACGLHPLPNVDHHGSSPHFAPPPCPPPAPEAEGEEKAPPRRRKPPSRRYALRRGDAVFFRGEKCEHWISDVARGRRVVLQMELSKRDAHDGWSPFTPYPEKGYAGRRAQLHVRRNAAVQDAEEAEVQRRISGLAVKRFCRAHRAHANRCRAAERRLRRDLLTENETFGETTALDAMELESPMLDDAEATVHEERPHGRDWLRERRHRCLHSRRPKYALLRWLGSASFLAQASEDGNDVCTTLYLELLWELESDEATTRDLRNENLCILVHSVAMQHREVQEGHPQSLKQSMLWK